MRGRPGRQSVFDGDDRKKVIFHLSFLIWSFTGRIQVLKFFDFVLAPEERDGYSTRQKLVISLRKVRNVSAGETV